VIPTVARFARIALYSVVDRVGVAPVYRASFLIKIALSALAIFVAVFLPGDSYLGSVALPAMLVLGSVVVAAPLGMFALTVSELVDEQRYEEARSSAAVVGDGRLVAGRYQSTHALFAKPCNSLGPIIVSLVLPGTSIGTGRSVSQISNSTFDRGGEELRETAQAQMCFTLISVLPLVAGCVQFYIWRSYTLSKDRVERIQHALCKQARRAEGEEWDEPPNTQQLHNP
jgi:Na+/melibiose symporter-like transporter